MESLEDFYEKRGLDEATITSLRNEKIDSHVISIMSDEELAKFIPKYGDRIAIRQFCQRVNKKENRKETVLEKLRRKINSKYTISSSDEEKEEKKKKKKKYKIGNEKKTRQVEIGWMCSLNGGRYVQVKTKCGGGTRKVQMAKSSKKPDFIQKGIDLFFQDGVSSKGNIDKFSFNLLDFKGQVIDEDITLEDMFEKTSLARLRIYLATKEKTSTLVSDQPSTADIETNKQDNLLPCDINNCVLQAKSGTDGVHILMESGNVNMQEEIVELDYYSTLNNDEHEGVNEFSNLIDNVIVENSLQSAKMTSSLEPQIVTLYLHRGQVFEELLSFFLNNDNYNAQLNIKMILPNGTEESGHDLGGVFRDALSEFWGTFKDKYTTGTSYKVPYIRNDFDSKQWNAVAHILYKGYVETDYFPLDLAPVFIEMCINNNIKSNLMDSFFGYISKEEADILQKAIKNFTDVDSEELVDVLSNFECKTIPTEDNVLYFLQNLAHKELIQKSKYVIDCWNDILKNMMSDSELTTIYSKRQITSKNIISLLSINDEFLNADQQKVFDFLKKFLRESEKIILRSFLRFCTGADVITSNNINVCFNSKSGLTRVPTAQTCGCILQLPTTYTNFPEFRTEFNTVLQSNVWIMDFI